MISTARLQQRTKEVVRSEQLAASDFWLPVSLTKSTIRWRRSPGARSPGGALAWDSLSGVAEQTEEPPAS